MLEYWHCASTPRRPADDVSKQCDSGRRLSAPAACLRREAWRSTYYCSSTWHAAVVAVTNGPARMLRARANPTALMNSYAPALMLRNVHTHTPHKQNTQRAGANTARLTPSACARFALWRSSLAAERSATAPSWHMFSTRGQLRPRCGYGNVKLYPGFPPRHCCKAQERTSTARALAAALFGIRA